MESKFDPQARLQECKQCEHKRDLPLGLIQCKKCGCVMNVKVKLNGAKCPIDKW